MHNPNIGVTSARSAGVILSLDSDGVSVSVVINTASINSRMTMLDTSEYIYQTDLHYLLLLSNVRNHGTKSNSRK